MFLKENEEFLKDYLELFISRFIHSSLTLNPTFGDIDDAQNIFRLYDQTCALKKLFSILFFEKRDLTLEDIIDTANIVNRNALYISNGYRKIGKTFANTKKAITPPEMIPLEMERLLQTYETEWKELPILEKVTKFHHRFLAIHPFEDGNGRVARMILSFQLLKEGLNPFLLTKEQFQKYHESLYYDREDDLLLLFQEQYEKERQYVELWLQKRKEEKGRSL